MRLAQFGEICYTASHVGRSEGQIRLDVFGSPGDCALGSDGTAGILTASALNFLKLLGWRHPKPVYTWLLSGNNLFPCQVALALLLGWILGRALQDRSMLWVWLLPSLGMAYALLNIPTLVPRLVKPEFQAGIGQSRLFHYFGSGCQLGNYCIDQTSFTRPFYAESCLFTCHLGCAQYVQTFAAKAVHLISGPATGWNTVSNWNYLRFHSIATSAVGIGSISISKARQLRCGFISYSWLTTFTKILPSKLVLTLQQLTDSGYLATRLPFSGRQFDVIPG